MRELGTALVVSSQTHHFAKTRAFAICTRAAEETNLLNQGKNHWDTFFQMPRACVIGIYINRETRFRPGDVHSRCAPPGMKKSEPWPTGE